MADQQSSLESSPLLEALHLLKRRRWPFLAVALLVLAGTVVVILRTTPLYRATVQVHVERQLPGSGTLKDLTFVESVVNQDYLNTQQKVIASRAVAERVAARLRWPSGSGDPPGDLLGRVATALVLHTRIISVSAQDTNPSRAADIANAFVAEYSAYMMDQRVASIRTLAAQLERESDGLREQLRQAEDRLQKFNEQNNLASTDQQQNLTVRRLEEATTYCSRMDQELAQLESVVDQVKPGDADLERLLSVEAVIENRGVQDLMLEEARVRQGLGELRKRYLPKHPAVLRAENSLKEVRGAVEREARKTVAMIRAQYDQTRVRRDKAREAVEELKREKIALDRLFIEVDHLRRKRDSAKSLYELLVQRIGESDIVGGLDIANISVVEKAMPAALPAKPNVPMNAAAGLVLALLLGAGSAVLVDRMNPVVKSIQEIEELTRLPVLGVVPEVQGGDPETAAARDPRSPAAEAFRTLRMSLQLSPKRGRPPRSILITSSGPHEGKTVSSLNLAVSMAQQDKRVLLLDANFHRPMLHQHLKVENDSGLSVALAGEGSIEGFAKPTTIPNLWVVPAGPVPPNPAELLGSPAFKARLEEMLGRFDCVVIDSPPLLTVTDACVMSPHADALVAVVVPRWTARRRLRRALGLLAGVGVAPVGVLLNRVPASGDGYYAD